MRIHDIKLHENFADAVLCGEKNFEIRENDRGYQKGDKVRFKVVNNSGLHVFHDIENQLYMITYLLCGWGLKDGYCVFGIKPWKEDE